MRLSDAMSAANLQNWAEAGLVIFFVAFVAIILRIWWPSRQKELESQSRLPLEEATPIAPQPDSTQS